MKLSAILLLLAATVFGIEVAVAAPEKSGYRIPFKLAVGKKIFAKSCVSCHGADLNGSDKGPTLIHKYYEPGHHSDQSFYRAVASGVKQHHWNFGDMPAVAEVTPRDTKKIIDYVRWVQRQNGIH